MRALGIVALLAVAPLVSHAQTPAEVFQQGQALGASGGTAIGREIGSGASAGTVPNYSDAQPQSSLFAGGSGSLVPPGAAQVSGCEVNPADPDARKRQQCDATNFLAKKSTAASFNMPPNDPGAQGRQADHRQSGVDPGLDERHLLGLHAADRQCARAQADRGLRRDPRSGGANLREGPDGHGDHIPVLRPRDLVRRRERRSQQRGPHDRVRLLRSGARPRASARPGLRATVRMARARDPSPSRSIRQGPAHPSARAISSLTGRTPAARRRRRSSPAAAPGRRCSARFDFAQLVRTFDPKTRTFVFVPTWLWSFWVSYQLPEVFVTEADSWDNQCSAYEARL